MNRKLTIFLIFLIPILAVVAFAYYNSIEPNDRSSAVFYVPNAGEGTVSVVDIDSNEVINTIQLGTTQASHGIAVSPDGSTIYTGTGFEGKSLLAIDASTLKKKGELLFNEGVHGIDISPDGMKLFVSLNPGLGKSGGGLAIVDTTNFSVVKIVETGEGTAHVAVKPDSTEVWVTNVNENTTGVIDVKQAALMHTIPVGKVPNEVALSPDGKYAYVANVESNFVSVIDTSTYKVIQELKAGNAPHGVTVSPDGKELWVSNNKSNDVSVIDLSTNQLVTSISTGAYANHVGFTKDGKWAYVSNRESNDLVKIDARKKEMVTRISVGKEPHEISLEDFVFDSQISDKRNEPNEISASIAVSDSNNDLQDRIRSAQVDMIEIDVIHLEPSDLKNSLSLESLKQSDFEIYEIFQIALTTHSGDLSELRLDEKTYLAREYGKDKVAKWLVESNDSHHPKYFALFSKKDRDINEQLTLEIEGFNADSPIQFVW